MILSIIIPVYNVEPFVERCIRSCEAQNIAKNKYEIICINDGSKDNSLKIISRIADEFPNIHVFSQPNAGLSAARNDGMRVAKGDYYMFVDSDDWIAENCLGMLTDKLREERPDVLTFCAANVVNGVPQRRMSYSDETPITGRDFIKWNMQPCAPFSIWSAKFFKTFELKFFEGIFHEDSELIPRAFYLAKKVSFSNELIYFVYLNQNSICRTVNPKKSFDLVNIVCNNLNAFNTTVSAEYQHVFINMISMYLNNALNNIGPDKRQHKLLNEVLFDNRHLFDVLKKSTILKYRIEGLLFKMFPHHCYRIFKLMKGQIG